jgi:hypothetical protein
VALRGAGSESPACSCSHQSMRASRERRSASFCHPERDHPAAKASGTPAGNPQAVSTSHAGKIKSLSLDHPLTEILPSVLRPTAEHLGLSDLNGVWRTVRPTQASDAGTHALFSAGHDRKIVGSPIVRIAGRDQKQRRGQRRGRTVSALHRSEHPTWSAQMNLPSCLRVRQTSRPSTALTCSAFPDVPSDL